MRIFLYLLLSLQFAFFCRCLAQTGEPDSLIDKKTYNKNIRIYRDILKKGPNRDVTIKLAEALRLVEKYDEAEKEYASFIERPGINPIYYKHYSEILCKTGQTEECGRWELRYKEYVKRADKTSDATIEIDTGRFFFNSTPFNSAETDFGPAYFKNGLLYVSAFSAQSKSTVHEGTGESYYHFYYAEKKSGGGFNAPVEIFRTTDATTYEGPVSLPADNSEIILVKNNLNELKAKTRNKQLILKLVKGKITNNEITEIQDLPFTDKVHTFTHPALSADGSQLYFASNSDSTRGGSDIFVSARHNGKWSEPENLGSIVNTEEDEVYPFISSDGKLYFSSSGHKNFGGFDIFMTEKINGSWTKPVNLGQPFNTIFDDFSFINHPEEKEGFLASNRASSLGNDDIFTFKEIFSSREEEKRLRPLLISIVNRDHFVYQRGNKIRGKLIYYDTAAFAGKAVVLLDANKHIVKKSYITADGYFSFSNLKPDNYLITYEEEPIDARAVLTLINRKPGYIDKEDLNKFKIAEVYKDSLQASHGGFVVGKLVTLNNSSTSAENVSLIVVDSAGKIVKRLEVGKDSYFIYRNIPSDHYFVLTEDYNPNFSCLMSYHNSEKSKGILREDLLEFHFKHLTSDSLRENNIILHGQIKINEPGNTTILLLDREDNVIGTTVANDSGFFVFRELDGEDMHVMILNNNPLKAFEHATVYQKEDSAYHITKNRTMEKLQADEHSLRKKVIINGRLTVKEKPLDNRLLLLVDKNNLVVEDCRTNEDGFFAFKHITPDDYYIVVNDNEPGYRLETQINYEDDKMKVDKAAFEGFEYRKENSEKFISIKGTAFTFSDKKLLDNKLILLLDGAGRVVRQTISRNGGKFSFVNLEPDHYLILFNIYDPEQVVELKVAEDPVTRITQTENGKTVTLSLPIAKEKNKVIIFFDYNSDKVAESYEKELEGFIQELKNAKTKMVEITGFTDMAGSDTFNLKLSEKRIANCSELLIKNAGGQKLEILRKPEGKTDRFHTTYGVYVPALNRRVEMMIRD